MIYFMYYAFSIFCIIVEQRILWKDWIYFDGSPCYLTKYKKCIHTISFSSFMKGLLLKTVDEQSSSKKLLLFFFLVKKMPTFSWKAIKRKARKLGTFFFVCCFRVADFFVIYLASWLPLNGKAFIRLMIIQMTETKPLWLN